MFYYPKEKLLYLHDDKSALYVTENEIETVSPTGKLTITYDDFFIESTSCEINDYKIPYIISFVSKAAIKSYIFKSSDPVILGQMDFEYGKTVNTFYLKPSCFAYLYRLIKRNDSIANHFHLEADLSRDPSLFDTSKLSLLQLKLIFTMLELKERTTDFEI